MFYSYVPTGLTVTFNNPRGMLASRELNFSMELAAKFDEQRANERKYIVVSYDVIQGDLDASVRVTFLPENSLYFNRLRQNVLLKNYPEAMWMQGPSLRNAHVNVVGFRLSPFSESGGRTRAQFELLALTGCVIVLPMSAKSNKGEIFVNPSGVRLRKATDDLRTVAVGRDQRGGRRTIAFRAPIVINTLPHRPREMVEFGINRTSLHRDKLHLA
jgi:hypothetical protein